MKFDFQRYWYVRHLMLAVALIVGAAAFGQVETTPQTDAKTAEAAGAEPPTAAPVETAEPETAGGNWIPFLGRLHPVVLHMPIGFLFALFLLEILTLGRSHSTETSVAKWMLLVIGSVAAIAAATFGVFLSWSGGYDPDLEFWHQWLGIAVAVLSVIALTLKTQYARLDTSRYRWAYRVVLLATVGVLFPASHYGAAMTHGATYLTKYLPESMEFLRPILGETPEAGRVTVEDGLFAREVLPILQAKCFECHSAEKQEGEYRLDSAEHYLAAGESARPAILPGNAIASHLVELILLPEEDEHVMPPYGKPALEPEETITLVRWINRGAPWGAYEAPEPVVRELSAELDLSTVDTDTAAPLPLVKTAELMTLFFELPVEDLRDNLVTEPERRSQFKAIYDAAYHLGEAHNLLFSRNDHEYMSTPEWTAHTVLGRDACAAMGDAVKAQDYEAMKSTFVTLVKSCNDCHVQFEPSVDLIDEAIPVGDAAPAPQE